MPNDSLSNSFKKPRGLDLTGRFCLEISRGQLPSDMIERTSEMVNNFARKNLQSGFNVSRQNEFFQFLEGFPIFIGKIGCPVS